MTGTTKKNKRADAIRRKALREKARGVVERAIQHERFAVVAFHVDQNQMIQWERQLANWLYGDMPTSLRLLKDDFSKIIRKREDAEAKQDEEDKNAPQLLETTPLDAIDVTSSDIEDAFDDSPDGIDQHHWGHSKYIFVDDQVALAIATGKAGGASSWHVHQHKFNTFVIERGMVKIRVDHHTDSLLVAGDSLTVVPGLAHRMIFVEDSQLMELYHAASDSVIELDDIERIRPGWKAGEGPDEPGEQPDESEEQPTKD